MERARARRQQLRQVDRTETLWREHYRAQETADIRYEGWSASELARRGTQLRSTVLLLAGRVTDTVLNGLDSRFDQDTGATTQAAVVDLGYQCIVRRRRRPEGTIGYFVQIECRHPDFVAELLREVPTDWLGIETVVVQAEPPQPLAELTGEIGGYLQAASPIWLGKRIAGLTCHHAGNFVTLRDYYRTSPQAVETPSPDAQLVQVTDEPTQAEWLEVASDDAIRQAMHHRWRLTRTPRPGRVGQVLELVETFPHLGQLNRFPSMRIRSPQLRLFGIVNWPPRATFGRPGDSGSWAVDPAGMAWVGMVVAGRPDLGDTYAHCAAALHQVVTSELLAGGDEPLVEPRSIVRR